MRTLNILKTHLWPVNAVSRQHDFKTTCPHGQVKFELTSTDKLVDANFQSTHCIKKLTVQILWGAVGMYSERVNSHHGELPIVALFYIMIDYMVYYSPHKIRRSLPKHVSGAGVQVPSHWQTLNLEPIKWCLVSLQRSITYTPSSNLPSTGGTRLNSICA